jgi:hypothetical protein
MRVADFTTGSAKMRDALKTLRAHWDMTKNDWHDAASRHFEEKYLAVLDPEVLATLDRLNRLTQVVTAAEHECGLDRG